MFSLPGMTSVDKGDLVVFDGDTNRAPMGIALYRRARDGAMFAFVGGKAGPLTGYIGQYRLADDGTGYILVSDQQANQFRVYPREGAPGRPHEHTLVKTVPVAAIESDGSEVTSIDLGPAFPRGLPVAMSNGRVFHYYAWEDVAGRDLKIAPNGVPPGK